MSQVDPNTPAAPAVVARCPAHRLRGKMKTRSKSLIDEALEAWAYTRQGVMAEMKNLPESALDFKPSEASRTTRALMQHIIESGLLMAGELPRPDGDFQRKPYAELLV